MKLTALVTPSPETLGPTESTFRVFHHVDDFCAALSAAGVPVTIVEGTLADVPDDGFLLVYRWVDLERHLTPELAPRLVVVAPPGPLWRLLWTSTIAAGINERWYSDWYYGHDDENGYGLLARKDMGDRWGATKIEPGYSTERYAEYAHPGCRHIPELLATYLAALAPLLAQERSEQS
ncbi:hypothetical protein [Nannocystis punicea]|uniref:Uncharacterized protein n=1 Tax=Nannocystis punicea TaxID=2995304 RepID=A0ABY7GV64_9BACT|nr:hypothetical protein [Nannocystis poenicansa]WAS90852.1 hypothetical protein O0S08_32085 [Nannocystis poenicansa]